MSIVASFGGTTNITSGMKQGEITTALFTGKYLMCWVILLRIASVFITISITESNYVSKHADENDDLVLRIVTYCYLETMA